MSFAALMVHVDVAEPHDDRIRLAARLSSRFASTLIGAAAWEPRPPLMYGGVVVDTEPTESLLQEMSDRLTEVGEHFRRVVGQDQPTEWRAGIGWKTVSTGVAAVTKARAGLIGVVKNNGSYYEHTLTTWTPRTTTVREAA